MTTIFDNDISTYEKELVEIIDKMEQARQGFVTCGVACLQKWYNTTARYFVQDRFEWTNDMGLAKLTEMKEKVNDLIQNTPTEIAKILSDDQHWWHCSRGGNWKDHHSKELPRGLQLAVFMAAVKLGPILKNYGYLKDDIPEFEPILDAPKNDQPYRERKKSPFDVEWTEEMLMHISAYKEHLGRAMYLDAKLREARKLKAKYEAAALWDKV